MQQTIKINNVYIKIMAKRFLQSVYWPAIGDAALDTLHHHQGNTRGENDHVAQALEMLQAAVWTGVDDETRQDSGHAA